MLAALSVLLLAGGASALQIPLLRGRLNDQGRFFDATAASALDRTLMNYEGRTGRQIVIWTIPSLEGKPLEVFSREVADIWRAEGTDREDSVLILVARRERQARFEVGPGLAKIVTDAVARRIIRDEMTPLLRKDDFAAGTQEGVAALIAALDGRVYEPSRSVLAADPGALSVPVLYGRINDAGRIFDTSEASDLEGTLKSYETRTGRRIVILTIPSLEGNPIEGFAHQAALAWRAGGPGRDDGVLIVVARHEREARIEVGDRLAKALPGDITRRIVEDAMMPRLGKGDFTAGIREGVAAVIAALESRVYEPKRTVPERMPDLSPKVIGQLVFFLVLLAWLDLDEIRKSGTNLTIYFVSYVMIPLCCLPFIDLIGLSGIETLLIIHVFGFPLGKLFMSRTAWGRRHQQQRSGPHRDKDFFFGVEDPPFVKVVDRWYARWFG